MSRFLTPAVDCNLGLDTGLGCVRHHLGNQLGLTSYSYGKQPGATRRAFIVTGEGDAQAAVSDKVYCLFTPTLDRHPHQHPMPVLQTIGGLIALCHVS